MSKFNNTKVRVSSAEECAKIQEAMFKEGFAWCGDGKEVQYTEAHFLFFEGVYISYCLTDENHFKENSNREISVEDILGKLINEKTMKDIKDFDKKALADAKKEIAKERADAQKEKAKDILREIYEKKDAAEEVIKSTEEDLEKIDESLEVFNKPKK